ncbi:DUF262 domain-containing protein [Saccharothrix sp. 6-C]|uniref:DUF262 domain-containing protein n=1 Tax=Saccharothrix sp. 6-C TaxID=2781735 RepID=UPI001916DF43|nr:DUF262 domain-containing protein [Saccharothrix sp. 6-C]QQQ75484.1 DUF262 domain-containing protein [Saccharothrix sp. 6-C]
MQANTLTPKKLFEPQVRYIIPVFQRPYVWSVDKQWMPLWDDVRAIAEEVLERVKPEDPVPPHFLGAVVLEQQFNPSGYIAMRHVIDGQQRLITLQLLLNAALQVTRQHGRPRDAALLETLVRNPAHVVDTDDEVLKVWPILADRAAFQAAMDDDHGNDDGEHRVSQGIRFLRERIEAWALEAPDEIKPADRLQALTEALALHLKLVVIDLDPDDNAQAIFEALNDRGSPLLAADLIKNAVFQLAEKHGVDIEKLNRDYWAGFDEEYWRQELRQGRLNRPRIDVFLNYWLTMRLAHTVPSDKIFISFRDQIVKDLTDVRPMLAELQEDSACYRQLASLPAFSVEGTFHYRVIEVADIAATMPLLLWLVRPGSAIPEPARHQALRAVESWVIRRLLCRVTLSDTNTLAVELLRHLKTVDREQVGKAAVEYLLAQHGDSRRWPTDDEVITSLESMRLYKTLVPRRRARMLLEALEDSYRSPKTEEAHCRRGDLTIEHIMPQSWQRYWPVEDDVDPADRNQHVQQLGNLTLVTSKLNPVVSNYPWLPTTLDDGTAIKGKRQIIDEHSVLLLNKHLLNTYGNAWDDHTIQERTRALAEQTVRIWPRGFPVSD